MLPRDRFFRIIESESPKFISPTDAGQKGCPECGKSYQPLVFTTNQVVDGQHFHDETEGGVYLFTALQDALSVFVDSSASSGFIAIVEPNGRIRNDRNNSKALRAEQVFVRAIKAYCVDLSCEYSYEFLRGEIDGRKINQKISLHEARKIRNEMKSGSLLIIPEPHAIREGILVSGEPNSSTTRNDLQALCCSLEDHPRYSNRGIKYRFEIAENREVHFSSLNQ